MPVVLVNIPTGHGGTYNEPMGGKGARIVTDWLQWQLRHDAKAQQAFIGEDCGLCRDPDATIERTVRAAAPFPAPARMGKVVYTDTWLWHKSGRFQLDTLTEGQD